MSYYIFFLFNRNPSPSLRQTPSPLCPSPDSCASLEGRVTPKLFISKLFTNPIVNSISSSPATEASSETDAPSEMDCGSDSATPPQSNKSALTNTNENMTEENSMDSGSGSTSKFKEAEKCDISSSTDIRKNIKADAISCDSTTTSSVTKSAVVETKSLDEKMTVDESIG